jgi:putative two-component system response regulator
MIFRGSVLIVDDEIGPRESLRMILKPFFDVFMAASGKAALEVIQKESIDVATVDLRMPGMNGIDLLKEIKRIKNDIEVIIVTAYGSLPHAIEAIRHGAIDFIAKPYNAAEIISVISKSIERHQFNLKIQNLIQKVMDLALGSSGFHDIPLSSLGASLGMNSGTEWVGVDFLESLKKWSCFRLPKVSVNYLDFLRVLVYLLESKEPYTCGHSERVSIYSEAIAQEMNLSSEEKENLLFSSLLHDIGKIGISNHVLENTNLSQNECLDLQQHPLKGVHLIEPLSFAPAVIQAIRHHHERWDGKGYPDGLVGSEIPLLARIIAVADSYDAMTSDRPYRPGLPPQDVWLEIQKNSGLQFDPEIVALFSRIFKGERVLPLVPSYFPSSWGKNPRSIEIDLKDSSEISLSIPRT